MYEEIQDETHCQCINCRLSRMEKQLTKVQDEFERFLRNTNLPISQNQKN